MFTIEGLGFRICGLGFEVDGLDLVPEDLPRLQRPHLACVGGFVVRGEEKERERGRERGRERQQLASHHVKHKQWLREREERSVCQGWGGEIE